MRTIEVTDEQYEMLKTIQHELKTQDNLATMHPLFSVYSKRNKAGPVDFATACFTRVGCLRFRDADGHNHKDLNIFVHSAHRNYEFQEIREFLMTVKL